MHDDASRCAHGLMLRIDVVSKAVGPKKARGFFILENNDGKSIHTRHEEFTKDAKRAFYEYSYVHRPRLKTPDGSPMDNAMAPLGAHAQDTRIESMDYSLEAFQWKRP